MGSKGKPEVETPSSGAAPATVIGEFAPNRATGFVREGQAQMLTREPGDLPVAVVLFSGRGVPKSDRGFPRVTTQAGSHAVGNTPACCRSTLFFDVDQQGKP
jgi:hypothetical protein